jgi:hypothetical protein
VHQQVQADTTERWVGWHWLAAFMSPEEMVAQVLNVFDEAYTDVPETQQRHRLLDEVADIMRASMLQPAIMYHYRRFVVLTGREDAREDNARGGGVCAQRFCIDRWMANDGMIVRQLEWMPLKEFDFGDEYWTEEEQQEMRSRSLT